MWLCAFLQSSKHPWSNPHHLLSPALDEVFPHIFVFLRNVAVMCVIIAGLICLKRIKRCKQSNLHKHFHISAHTTNPWPTRQSKTNICVTPSSNIVSSPQPVKTDLTHFMLFLWNLWTTFSRFKGADHPKMQVLSFTHLMSFKTCMSFFCWTQKMIFWRMLSWRSHWLP